MDLSVDDPYLASAALLSQSSTVQSYRISLKFENPNFRSIKFGDFFQLNCKMPQKNGAEQSDASGSMSKSQRTKLVKSSDDSEKKVISFIFLSITT